MADSRNTQSGIVFIVDDEEMVTRSIGAMLTLDTDFQIHSFNSPKEALEKATSLKPDVVVSDFLMPEMDGIVFLEQMKFLLPDVTAILLTGYADKENAIQAINKVGLYRYLEKPWDNDQLKRSIENGFERTRLLISLKETIRELQEAHQLLEQQNLHLEQLVEERTADLKRTYSQLDSIVRYATDGIVTLDDHFRITSANPAAQHMAARVLQDNLAQRIYGLSLDELATFPNGVPLSTAFQDGWTIRNIPEALLGDLPVEISVAPIPEASGAVLILRDISKRKEVDRLREDFVSTLTHDLRTPLLAAIQTLEFFVDGSVGELTSQQKDLLKMLIQSNREMLGLVNVLLEVYKYESGRQRLVFDAVQVPAMLESLCKELDALAQSREISLSLELPADIPSVWGDKQELRRVFVNLVGNALHYTPAGGSVRVVLKEDQVTMRQSTLRLEVIDTGYGIPVQDIPQLFQRFAQGTSKKRASGTGLGLYLSRQIVEAHGGKIGLTSEEGQGSTFYVNLPFFAPTAIPPLEEVAEA